MPEDLNGVSLSTVFSGRSRSHASVNPAPRNAATPKRRRGRPIEMAPEAVLERIQNLAARDDLFRVHRSHPALYARARRLFGTWEAAVRASGLDYASIIARAFERAARSRRRPLRRPAVTLP